ncbi:hypothetical protein SESBI_42897 [Sesbania bispinosa]|nr:hypothetical protein SESBI_42897 [Sesbania bispinosa]
MHNKNLVVPAANLTVPAEKETGEHISVPAADLAVAAAASEVRSSNPRPPASSSSLPSLRTPSSEWRDFVATVVGAGSRAPLHSFERSHRGGCRGGCHYCRRRRCKVGAASTNCICR